MKAIYKTKKDANGMFRLAHRVIVIAIIVLSTLVAIMV